MAEETGADEGGEMPELDGVRGELVSAFNRQEIAALAAVFAAEATLLPPGHRMIKGREPIQEFWSSVAEQVNEITMTPVSVRPLGQEAAREIGRISMNFGGQGPQEITSKYLLLWEKTAESWEIESFIWNRTRSFQQGRGPQGQNRRPGQVAYGQVPKLYSR